MDVPTSGSWQMRVLVVEDDARAAASLAELLRRAGYQVEVASDGPTAVSVARVRPPDAILLDLGLPGLDGWEVARQVQEQPAPKRPLLVAVTGHGEDEARHRSELAGIDLHLTKPVDPAGLQRLLGRFRSIIDFS